MNKLTRSPALLMLLLGIAVTGYGGDAPAPKTAQTTDQTTDQALAKTPANTTQQTKASSERATCMSYCDTSEGRCSSEVRRARQQCSKRAANAGRDPFTMRNNDYTYFCGYFNNGGACGNNSYGNSCRNRFARTYGLCVDSIQQNIASMRYDCYLTEQTAQAYCRDELRDCKAACP